MNDWPRPSIGRRDALALGAGAVGAFTAGAFALRSPAAQPPPVGDLQDRIELAAETVRWSPDPSDGLDAFEGVEDDRSDSHPGVTHIYVEDDHWRFDMHTLDRDGSDRQRNEVKGMRQNGTALEIGEDETWRISYQAFWPRSLTATTSFTHIMQMKVQDVGGPLWTLTPRLKGGTPTLTVLTLRDDDSNTEHVLGDFAPLQEKWIDVSFEFQASNSGGFLRWTIQDGSTTVVDDRTTDVDLWRDVNYLRPKWGIYRSLKSDGLQNTFQLLRDFRGVQIT